MDRVLIGLIGLSPSAVIGYSDNFGFGHATINIVNCSMPNHSLTCSVCSSVKNVVLKMISVLIYFCSN